MTVAPNDNCWYSDSKRLAADLVPGTTIPYHHLPLIIRVHWDYLMCNVYLNTKLNIWYIHHWILKYPIDYCRIQWHTYTWTGLRPVSLPTHQYQCDNWSQWESSMNDWWDWPSEFYEITYQRLPNLTILIYNTSEYHIQLKKICMHFNPGRLPEIRSLTPWSVNTSNSHAKGLEDWKISTFFTMQPSHRTKEWNTSESSYGLP